MATRIDLKTKTSANSTAEAFSVMMGGRKGDIQQLPINALVPYQDQPFRPYTKEKLIVLAEDIAENGVLSPIIVRLIDEDTYQILAGHNRVEACKLLGMDSIPSIVKPVDDNQAALIMLNTNLNQRDELLPSEKAFAYKMQLETMKRQGRRTDLCSIGAQENEDDIYSNGAQVKSRDIIADQNNTSREQVRRYIRLTYLNQPLLDRVDNGNLPFRAGVNLSYLTEAQQKGLLEYIDAYGIKITLDQSERLKDAAKVNEPEGILISKLDGIFDREPKPVKEKTPPSPFKKAYTAAGKRLEQYFTEGQEAEEIEDIIVTAVEMYMNSTKS